MTANAFLRHQVRRTAGALVEVGLGKLTVLGFRRLLELAEPSSAGPVAPARGLVLVRVDYDGLDLGGRTRYDHCLTGLEGPGLPQ
jgi:tRNA pseudouridine38-40 synthase